MSCTGCRSSVTQCVSCGRTDNLYENNEKILCADCLLEETGQEYYKEFAEVYEEEFRSFFLDVNEDIRMEG